jgi:ubiquinone/menaquinone biosynthesis C-methylase UbiE
VLDLATGDGVAAFASAARGAQHVVASDIASGHQPFIEQTAKDLGLGNVSFAEVDMEEIPYDEEAFDKVTSQFGIMFPPDRMRALKEIHRVLKPGGTFGAAVWGPPDENPEFYPALKHLTSYLPPALEGAPHPFNCGDREQLRREFAEAGFVDIEIADFPIRFELADLDAADRAWINTGPFAMAYARLDADSQKEIKEYIHQTNVNRLTSKGTVEFDSLALMARGRKS